jgi:hypothetical protein
VTVQHDIRVATLGIVARRSAAAVVHRHLDDLGYVQSPTVGCMLYLRLAAEAVGDDEGIPLGVTRSGQEPAFADLHREIVVLLLEAPGSC